MLNTGVLTKMSGFVYDQFGRKVLSTQMRFGTLEAIFEVDHEVQRQLDPVRRAEIRAFIIEAVEKEAYFYFSPFILSSRRKVHEVEGGFELEPGSKMYIIDGQHRKSALSSAISQLKLQQEAAEEIGDYSDAKKIQGYIEKLMGYPVALQVYLDLTTQEEQQLFSDTNTERREAHSGLRLKYDQRDKYSELTRVTALAVEDKMEIEMQASRLTKHNTALTSLTTMRRCLIALFEGVLTVKKGDPYFRNCKQVEVPMIAQRFFESWQHLFPQKKADRERYVTGLTGIQIALAYTVHTLMKEHGIKHVEAISMLALLKNRCTWQHDDPLFSHMYNAEKKQLRSHSNTTAIKKTTLEFLRVIHSEGKD